MLDPLRRHTDLPDLCGVTGVLGDTGPRVIGTTTLNKDHQSREHSKEFREMITYLSDDPRDRSCGLIQQKLTSPDRRVLLNVLWRRVDRRTAGPGRGAGTQPARPHPRHQHRCVGRALCDAATTAADSSAAR
jgi:hypothetical protein